MLATSRRAGLRGVVLAVLLGICAACSSSGSTPAPLVSSKPQAFPAPDIAGFLRNPIATPSACPAGQLGSATGLSSPWVGHVDISVFIKTSATAKQVAALGASIRQASGVAKVYFESQAEAFEEFQRLYTCWAGLARSQTPASYRVALTPTTRIDRRNALVARWHQLPGVDTVSCDPSLPCVNIVRSSTPTPAR